MDKDSNHWTFTGVDTPSNGRRMEFFYDGGLLLINGDYDSTFGVSAHHTFLASPFLNTRSGAAIDEVLVPLGGFSGGSVFVRAGLYANAAPTSLYPKTLIVDAGTFGYDGVSRTRINSIATTSLAPDTLYWMVCICSAASFFGIWSTGDPYQMNGKQPSASAGPPTYRGYELASSDQPLPATFPTSASKHEGSLPLILVRYSS